MEVYLADKDSQAFRFHWTQIKWLDNLPIDLAYVPIPLHTLLCMPESSTELLVSDSDKNYRESAAKDGRKNKDTANLW